MTAVSGAWKRLNVKGMNLLTQTDVGLNAVSSAILYDAVYRKEMKRNPGLSREEADRRAMMEVELSLPQGPAYDAPAAVPGGADALRLECRHAFPGG